MLKIKLNDLRFYGYHGVYEEENITGGDFDVNIVVCFEPVKLPIKHMEETLDYTQLYELVKRRMNKQTKLIETLATEIAQEIFNSFSIVDEVEVSVIKLNPPIPFFRGNVSATYSLKRNAVK
jgi:7,8-dihydroneopterin aldolase/epimerase/oxygenase